MKRIIVILMVLCTVFSGCHSLDHSHKKALHRCLKKKGISESPEYSKIISGSGKIFDLKYVTPYIFKDCRDPKQYKVYFKHIYVKKEHDQYACWEEVISDIWDFSWKELAKSQPGQRIFRESLFIYFMARREQYILQAFIENIPDVVKYGVIVDGYQGTFLDLAIKFNRTELIDILRKYGAKTYKELQTSKKTP